MSDEMRGTMVHEPVARGIGLTGAVVVSWAVAGGVLVGGMLVAGMTLAGRLSGNALLLTSTVLFILGAAIGLLHGAALGLLGRPQGLEARQAFGRLGMAVLYTVPALALGWLVSGWIAMTVVAAYLHRVGAWVGVGLGWVVGAALVAVAAGTGVRALRNALARWPDRRAGSLLVGASFAALLVSFLAKRPMLWGFDLQVTEIGAVLLAAFVAIWMVGPVVTVGLMLLRRLPGEHPSALVQSGRLGSGLAIGLAVGALLGLLALPFHFGAGIPAPAAATGPAGSVVLALSRALVDEIFLRLFAMTSVLWLLLRWRRSREESITLAVLAAAALQLALYAPAIVATGFATPTTALLYAVVAVLLPAAAFGVVYWLRGLGPAVVANATAAAALALLIG